MVWSWWAWQNGGYFETVWLPGTMVLCAAAATLLVLAPGSRVRPRGGALVALAALAALAVWSALSALWSPAPDIAIADAQRILMYALAFGVGVWLGRQLGARLLLALVPLAAAAAFAGVATVIALLGAETPNEFLHVGTLEYPLGYRNANAAFFLIAFFPAAGLAADRGLDWRARGLALATATLSLELAMLSQSRAAVPAAAVALVVYALLSPLRARALAWLALAVIPALGVLPALLELFDVANADPRVRMRVLGELEDTGMTIAGTVSVALVIGWLGARFERHLPALGSRSGRWNRAIAVGLAALAAVPVIGFVAAGGEGVDWIEDRIDEFRYTGTPSVEGQSSRFSVNVGTERYDFWRVALEDARSDPLLGQGGGGFQYSYLRQRDEPNVQARDAHSVELEVLSELGFPGLLLLLCALTAGVAAALRARRAGPAAATLTAIALASAAYWLVHASVDWFWTYSGVTAPALALLGSAAGAGIPPGDRPPSRLGRGLTAAALAILGIVAIPPFLSARYVDDAFELWRSDLDGAYADLDRARDFNPLADMPLLAEGAIARAAGDRDRALSAFSDAVAERPEEWAGHYLLALLQVEARPGLAREQVAIALELNPRDEQVRTLARRLGVRPPPLD